MIIVYRNKESREADEIEEQLKQMVAAYRVVDVDESGDVPVEAELPVITETGRVHADSESIAKLLSELRNELSLNRMVSADACYVDPEDPSRCI